MINAVWFMAGAISAVFALLIMATIIEWAEECGHKKIMKIVEEYENKLDDKDAECDKRLEQQREDLHEHTRKCLEEQKKKIEETERKAREYQSARFEEERAKLANENFDSGREQGRNEMIEKLRKGVQSGEIIINRKDQ